MNKLNMYCLCLNNDHYNIVKDLKYIPVGLGNNKFSPEWLRDNDGDNISNKNSYYGEYTFHYWLWKNYLDKINDDWIGFCQYRKFWSVKKNNLLPDSLEQLKTRVLNEIPKSHEDFEVILGDQRYINQFKLMKF